MSKLSPLQLRSFRLVHLRIDTYEEPRIFKGENGEAEYDIETDFDVLKVKNKMIFRIPLAFTISSKGESQHSSLKRLDMKMEGIFALPDDLPDEMVQKLVPYNCIAILYSLSRGLILSVTGNIRGGSLLLPTLDFTNVIKKRMQKEAGKKLALLGEDIVKELNPRQVKILEYIQIHKKISGAEGKKLFPGISEKIIRNDLDDLETRGLLGKSGRGRAVSYYTEVEYFLPTKK